MVYGLGLLAAGERGGHGSAEAVSSTSARPGRAVTERHSPAVFTDPAVPLHGLQSLVCPTCVCQGPAGTCLCLGKQQESDQEKSCEPVIRAHCSLPLPAEMRAPFRDLGVTQIQLGLLITCHELLPCLSFPSLYQPCLLKLHVSSRTLSSLVSCWHNTIPLRSHKIKPLLVKKHTSRTMCRQPKG